MKTDRLFVTRAAAVLLAGLLLMTGHPVAGGSFHIGVGGFQITYKSPAKRLAAALAHELKGVQTRFGDNRRALHAMAGVDGKPAYLRKDVKGLMDRTAKDLDDAITKVNPSDLQPLASWVDDELGRLQGEITGAPVQTAAVPAGFFAPQPVEMIASLGNPPKKKPASPKPAVPVTPPAPPPDAVPAAKADGVLDEVGKVLSRIFTLADKNDLEVKLWVGSAPEQNATFRFWPQGRAKGAMTPAIITTASTQRHVMRGLYSYEADWGKGAVIQQIKYPDPTASLASARLDLVTGSSFFCCRFGQGGYCQHVDDEKDCR